MKRWFLGLAAMAGAYLGKQAVHILNSVHDTLKGPFEPASQRAVARLLRDVECNRDVHAADAPKRERGVEDMLSEILENTRALRRNAGSGRTVAGTTNDVDMVSAFALGHRVFHQKLGFGRITGMEGNSLTVDFEKLGQKRVVASFVEAS